MRYVVAYLGASIPADDCSRRISTPLYRLMLYPWHLGMSTLSIGLCELLYSRPDIINGADESVIVQCIYDHDNIGDDAPESCNFKIRISDAIEVCLCIIPGNVDASR